MPEGDTIHRTASTLAKWLGGRTITAARSTMPGVECRDLIGRRVESVTARGKNLVILFVDDRGRGKPLALRTHMMMTGSWHVYEKGVRWQRPRYQARIVLEAGDRIAVSFNVPVATLNLETVVEASTALRDLGPDVLVEPCDIDDVLRRAQERRPATVGSLLLDQRIVAGIGNVYRCEALFLAGLDPWTKPTSMDPDTLRTLIVNCSELMCANVDHPSSRDTGAGRGRAWVYGRRARPCLRCETPIRSGLIGDPVRRIYWCPTCQPSTRPPADSA